MKKKIIYEVKLSMSLLVLVLLLIGVQFQTGVFCFNCSSTVGGYYADMEDDCRSYHMCGPTGRHFRFQCPPGTRFHQRFFVCDHISRVSCADSGRFFDNNRLIGRTSSIDNNLLDFDEEFNLAPRSDFSGVTSSELSSELDEDQSSLNSLRTERKLTISSQPSVFRRVGFSPAPESKTFRPQPTPPKSNIQLQRQESLNALGVNKISSPANSLLENHKSNEQSSARFLLSIAGSEAPLLRDSRISSPHQSRVRSVSFNSADLRRGIAETEQSRELGKILMGIADGSFVRHSKKQSFSQLPSSNIGRNRRPSVKVSSSTSSLPNSSSRHRPIKTGDLKQTVNLNTQRSLKSTRTSPVVNTGITPVNPSRLPANQQWRLKAFNNESPFSSNENKNPSIQPTRSGVETERNNGAIRSSNNQRRGVVNKVFFTAKNDKKRKQFAKALDEKRLSAPFKTEFSRRTITLIDRRKPIMQDLNKKGTAERFFLSGRGPKSSSLSSVTSPDLSSDSIVGKLINKGKSARRGTVERALTPERQNALQTRNPFRNDGPAKVETADQRDETGVDRPAVETIRVPPRVTPLQSRRGSVGQPTFSRAGIPVTGIAEYRNSTSNLQGSVQRLRSSAGDRLRVSSEQRTAGRGWRTVSRHEIDSSRCRRCLPTLISDWNTCTPCVTAL